MSHCRLIRLLYVLITIALCMQLALSGWNVVSGISNNPTGWTLAGIFLYPLTIVLIFYFLRGIVGSLKKMELFAYANIRRLRYIGYCYLGYSLFRIIKDLSYPISITSLRAKPIQPCSLMRRPISYGRSPIRFFMD